MGTTRVKAKNVHGNVPNFYAFVLLWELLWNLMGALCVCNTASHTTGMSQRPHLTMRVLSAWVCLTGEQNGAFLHQLWVTLAVTHTFTCVSGLHFSWICFNSIFAAFASVQRFVCVAQVKACVQISGCNYSDNKWHKSCVIMSTEDRVNFLTFVVRFYLIRGRRARKVN